MYNTAIIGAGPAGYTAAIRLAQLGKSVLLIERDLVGGICINWGCTPSKAMIASAKAAHQLRRAKDYGVVGGETRIDFDRVVARRDAVIAAARDEVSALIRHWGIDLVAGEAEVLSPDTVRVGGKGYSVENIIYATGSEPIIPPFVQPDDPSVIGSNALVTIRELPQELTVIGGGIIAFEVATIFSNLGTKVRIVELSCDCLTCLDTDVGAVITRSMEQNGVQIMTNHKVVSLNHGTLVLENLLEKQPVTLSSPLNLIAVGRRPVINSPELSRLGIEHTPRGIVVDEFMRTTIPNVYATGDSTGKSILAHAAIQQALIAAEHICGGTRPMRYDVIPAVIYTIPEGATVGFTPKSEPPGIRNVRYPFSANLRAVIEGHTEGFAKLWIDEKENKLVGAQVVHEYAGEIIQGYANAIQLGLPLDVVAETIHAHPTYNEIVRNSFEYALGRAVEYH